MKTSVTQVEQPRALRNYVTHRWRNGESTVQRKRERENTFVEKKKRDRERERIRKRGYTEKKRRDTGGKKRCLVFCK